MSETGLARYRLEEKIGEGGMGVVYRATDLRLGRTVALKMLRPGTNSDASLRRRLDIEARTASSLNHPAIATLYDFEAEGESAFLVYEYVRGKTLRDREAEGSLTLTEVLNIFVRIAEGIARAHDSGIVHRDLKPENVMIAEDGAVKILDFGLAKLSPLHADGLTAATAATAPGVLLGTVAYMSPEQLENEPVDHRTDVFSFGSMLYEFVSKHHPFRGKSPGSTIGNILKEEPVHLTRWASNAPEELERVIRKCLCKRKEERYQSMHDVAVDLEAIYRSSTGFIPMPALLSDFALPMPQSLIRGLFLLCQFGYVALYGAALYHIEAVGTTLTRDFGLDEFSSTMTVMITAMCGIAVRLYLITAVGFHHPQAARNFHKLFPALLVLDALWAASPLFLWSKLLWTVLVFVAFMAYLPFAQRTLLNSLHSRRTR